MKRIVYMCSVVLFAAAITAFFAVNCLGQDQATITLDPATTYQTMTGWEIVAYASDMPGHSASYPAYMDEMLNLAVNDLGIARVRLEIYPVTENPVDYAAQMFSGQITVVEFVHERAQQIVNDNDNPDVINPAGFHFTYLDHKVDNIVLPMKQFLQAKGEDLYVALNFVDPRPYDFELCDHPDEYGEFILAAFQHMEAKYDFVPDAVEVILEPDNAVCWEYGTTVGTALAAAGQRLAALGYTPDFIAPSTLSMSNAISYFDDLIQVAGVQQYISELSYHRYGGVSLPNLQTIASRGAQYGIDTSMLEWWTNNNTYRTLHEDLKVGNNSAWQQGGLTTIGAPNNSVASLYMIDETDPSNPQVVINNPTKYLRQYFKFVRPGAVRIGATTSNGDFDPLAFINTDDKYVVVVKANRGGDVSIQGLPAGTYGIKYTTGVANNPPLEYDVDLTDVVINSGQTLNTSIPDVGVITVYAKELPATPTPPSDVTISGPTMGLVGGDYTFTATVSPVTATQPITYIWQASGQSKVTYVGGLSSNVTFSWEATGTQTATATAANAGGVASDTHSINIQRAPTPIAPSEVLITGPTTGLASGEQSFVASVSPPTTTLPVTHAWQAIGQAPVTNIGGLSDMVTFTWDVTGTYTITVAAMNAHGEVTDTHLITVSTGHRSFLPLVLRDWF